MSSAPLAAALEEPPEPPPSPAIRLLLDEAADHEKAGRRAEALQVLERSVAAARAAQEAPGEAAGLRRQAALFQQSDRIQEAIAAWRKAAAAWEQVGDGPAQIEALGSAAALLLPGKTEDAHGLLKTARSLTGAETKRPRAALYALNDSGLLLSSRGRPAEAVECYCPDSEVRQWISALPTCCRRSASAAAVSR